MIYSTLPPPPPRPPLRALISFRDKREGKIALDTLARMPAVGSRPTIISYNMAMSACASCGMMEQSLALLAEMPTVGLVPNVFSFSIAISSCVSNERYKSAVEIYYRMREAGIRPDYVCNVQGLLAMRNCGKWTEAVALLDEMLLLASEAPAPPLDGASPNPSRGEGVPSQTDSTGRVGRSGGWTNKRRSSEHPTLHSFNTVIGACADAGQGNEAWRIFRKINKFGLKPDGSSYGLVMKALRSGGRWKQAVTLLREMPTAGVEVTDRSYAAVITVCAKANNWEMALSLLREMPRKNLVPNAYIYNPVR